MLDFPAELSPPVPVPRIFVMSTFNDVVMGFKDIVDGRPFRTADRGEWLVDGPGRGRE